MALIYLSCAWVVGTFLGLNFHLPPALIFIGLIPLPFLFVFRQHRKFFILLSICTILLFSGAIRSQSSLPTIDETQLQFYNDQGTTEIRGLIGRDPKDGDKTTQLYLTTREIRLGEDWYEVSGKALLFVPRYSPYEYGDVLLVRGELETPVQFDEFDYRGYLANQGIYSTMLYPEIEVLDSGKGFRPLGWVYSLRNRLSQSLSEVLPEPQASLTQGITLGMRSNIPSSVRDDFAHTGTAHLLAISGLHLSIVAGIMLSFGRWVFGRKGYIYIWLALGAIWLYAILTGMYPPILRATIMVSLFLITELLGRQRSAFTALAFAAAIMVGINPQVLQDAAFQMSFTAMAGLIFIFPPIQSLARKVINTALGEEGLLVSTASFIADSFSVSLGAIIAVWPVVAYHFNIISPVAPLATFFAVLALPGIIVTGALVGVLGIFTLPVAQIAGWLTWLFTSYMLFVVNLFTVVPHIKTGSVDISLICVYYAALAMAIWINNNRKKTITLTNEVVSFVSRSSRKWVVYPLVVVAILISITAVTMPDDDFHISFLDVGQGDAILIQKGNQQILVDGGPSPQAINLALSKKMPFWDRTIDLVVLTHPSADHVTGLVEVLNRYKVDQVLYPNMEFNSRIYTEWLQLLGEKDINYTLARAGQQISFKEAIIEVLNPQIPPLTGTESDIDNNGVVLRLEIDEVSFLLTADMMWEAEYELITHRADLTSTVLKVAHHGSTTSTSDEFLVVVNPQVAIICVGEENSYGHPSQEVLDRLNQKTGPENIYRTDEDGTIEFITDGENLWVRVER